MNMNSVQLFQLWRSGSKQDLRMVFDSDSPYSRSYYRALCIAIYREAVTDGTCLLLDELLTAGRTVWDPVTFYAVLKAAEYVSIREELPEPDHHYLHTLDGTRYPWQHLNPNSQLPLTAERKYCMTLIHFLFRSRKESRPPEPIVNPTEEAGRIIADARAEAERILDGARQARDEMIRQANEQVEMIENTALERAANTELNAQRKAQQITQEAQQNAEDCYEQAYDDAKEKAMERLEAEAAAESQRLIRQNLTDFMRQQRQQWQDAQSETEQVHQYFAGQTAALKEQVCQQTTAAGADMTRMMEETINQLTALKNGFFTGLQDWRASLYKAEYGPLINCYNNLLMLIAGFDRDVAAEQQRREGELTGTELSILQQHNNKMEKFRMNMERAMLAVGLRVFRPAEGDIFDSYAHATDDEEDDDNYNGCAIARCIRPGIIRTVNSANEEVLHRATVTISRPTDAFDSNYDN